MMTSLLQQECLGCTGTTTPFTFKTLIPTMDPLLVLAIALHHHEDQFPTPHYCPTDIFVESVMGVITIIIPKLYNLENLTSL